MKYTEVDCTHLVTEVKPCPICGGKASIVVDCNDEDSWQVECDDYDGCGFYITSAIHLSYEDALRLWNSLDRPKPSD